MSERLAKGWRRATISINETALKNNLRKVREYAPNSKVMAVIKANAYGHGMLSVAKQLVDADLFAVAMSAEAFALRADGCHKPVVVLQGFFDTTELEQFSKLNISTVVHQRKQLNVLLAHDSLKPIDVWIKVDTGMHRLGISVDEVTSYYNQLHNSKNVSNVYLMSHFANADMASNELNNMQLSNFINVINSIDEACSMANSAAIIRLTKSHLEIVRPGIMLYGSSPISDTSATMLGLQAVMQFESVVIDIKTVDRKSVV